jgi:hypothetical protein
MTRHLMLRVTVKDGERALLTRDGRLEQVLEPGRHRLLDPMGKLAFELHEVVRAEFPADRYAVVKAARPICSRRSIPSRMSSRSSASTAARSACWVRGRPACSGRSRPGSRSSASM